MKPLWIRIVIVAGVCSGVTLACGEDTRRDAGSAGAPSAGSGASGANGAGGSNAGGTPTAGSGGAVGGGRAEGGTAGRAERSGGSAGTGAPRAGAGGEAGADEGSMGGEGAGGSGGEPAAGVDCDALPAPLAYTPELFALGDDPSTESECSDVLNPERGFFRFRDLRSLGDTSDLRAEGHTLIYGRALLDDYREQDLDAALLETLATSFSEIRAAGIKVLPRFYYADDGSSPDAPLERVLEHVAALTPLLSQHSDVVAALHAGFVGAWGEWHGSTNDLTEPENREAVFDALLAALPASRMVLARRPSHKLEAYGGPLDEGTAFAGDAVSRVGHLNDCFLASDDDMGTYQLSGEKEYAELDSAYTANGGETCAVNPPRSACAAAEDELALHHWSFLNLDYHPDVIEDWQAEGCFERIRCRLGYRFALLAFGTLGRASAGETLPLSLGVFNDGYARAYNARPAFLVLQGDTTRAIELDTDVRRWAPGEATELCLAVPLPGDLPEGSYRLGLAFPDADLPDDPRFAVRLSSGASWDEAAGVNWLDANLTIDGS